MQAHWQIAANMLYPIPAVMEPDILMHRLIDIQALLIGVTNANAHRTEHAYLMLGHRRGSLLSILLKFLKTEYEKLQFQI